MKINCVYFVQGCSATNEEPEQSDYCKFYQREINGCCEYYQKESEK